MSNKSGIADNIINLPEGGGAQKGMGETFSPDLHSGTGNFSFPIAVPPGRNGLQPALTVGYSSGNGNGEFGLGWGLSIPGIMRKTNRGIPKYDDKADTFILSGAEDLIPVDYSKNFVDGVWHFKTKYRPRTEGLFARITHHKTNQGINYWEVRSKDGLTSYYGNPNAKNPDDEANTVIAHPERRDDIFAWKLYRTVDVFGNDMRYTYTRELKEEEQHHYDQLYLSKVDYTNYNDSGTTRYLCSVAFEYEDRPDPFSTHLAGFEIRTTQRVKHVRTYTHPKDADRPTAYTSSGETFIDILVKRYDFFFVDERIADGSMDTSHAPKNGASILSQVQVCGFDHQTDPEKLPPLEFRYSGFEPIGKDFLPIEGEHLPPVSLAHPEYEVADLNGNGLPDIVQINGEVARYWRNKGDGQFDRPRNMKEAPAGVSLAEAGVTLADADGDGRVDLMVNKSGISGYFSLNPDGEWDRRSLKQYTSAPSFSFQDPEVQLMDMSGDGITDVLKNGSRLELYYQDREEGWNDHRFVNKAQLNDFPNLSFSDSRVRIAGFGGGGLQDIGLIQNGNIYYWPNQGYGNWGKKVFMKNSPRLPHGYDPARIMLADFDGDGLVDMAYIDHCKVTLWINQSGNAWSEPFEIKGTPQLTNMDAVRAIDMMGDGVPGILWSYDEGKGPKERMYYLNLTGGIKPYLLNEMVNNMGALTRVQYHSSLKDYLRDLNSKAPEDNPDPQLASAWATTLPMPVLVVGKTEVHDLIAHSKLVTEYKYHHGYWDGIEREFRGFGRVDQLDTETFNEFNQTSLFHGGNEGWHSAEIPETKKLMAKADSGINRSDRLEHNQVEKLHYTPPVFTKSWFHQGPVVETAIHGSDVNTDWRELDHSKEYFPEKWDGTTPQAITIERPQEMQQLLKSLPRSARRDAYRTLRGAVLRTEMYALDGTRFQHKPYTVTEAQYGVRQEFEPSQFSFPDEGRPGWVNPNHSGHIFMSFSVGQRTTQWERGNDPMTSFAFTRNHDAYGIPLEQCAIAIPRYRNFLIEDGNPPKAYAATYGNGELIHVDTESQYLIGRSKKAKSFEIINDGTDDVFSLVEKIFSGEAERNLLGQNITYYDGDPCQAFKGLPYGQIGDYGVPVRSMSLVATDCIWEEAYGEIPELAKSKNALDASYPAEFKALLPNALGYKRESSNVQYLVDKKPQRDPLTNRTVLIDEGGEQRPLRGSRCYDFDGSSHIIFSSGYPLYNNVNEAAVSLWFKTTATGEQYFMDGDSNSFLYVIGLNAGKIWVRSADSSYGLGTTLFNDDNWHFLTVNMETTNRLTKVYVDGELEYAQTWGSASASNISLYYFGAAVNAGHKFNGQLKDLRLYTKQLSEQEREDIQNFKLLGCEKVHLPCEEEAGSIALNRLGYNGIITGATLSSFHSTAPDLGYSFADRMGYALADGSNHYASSGVLLDQNVVIPIGENPGDSCALDANDDPHPLDHLGRAAYNAHITNNACLNLDPDDSTYAELQSALLFQENKSYKISVDWIGYDKNNNHYQSVIGNNGDDNQYIALYANIFGVMLGSTFYSHAHGVDLGNYPDFTLVIEIDNIDETAKTLDLTITLNDIETSELITSKTWTSINTSGFINDSDMTLLFGSYDNSGNALRRRPSGKFSNYSFYVDDELTHQWVFLDSGTKAYDVVGGNHATLHSDDLTTALSTTQNRYSHKAEYGFTRYTEDAGSGVIEVPYDLEGSPLSIATPSGYTKEADYPAGEYLYDHAEYTLDHAIGLEQRIRSELDGKTVGVSLGENDRFVLREDKMSFVQISLDGNDFTQLPFDAPGYYVEGGKAKFDFHDESETTYGRSLAMRDSLDREATVTFDDYDLLPETVTDPVGMETEAWYDYRLFTPRKAKDPNNNFAEFAFNRLGLLYKSAAKAKYDVDDGSSDVADRIADDLDHPPAILEYDFFNFMNNGDPIWVKTTQRQYHYYGPTPEFGDKEDTLISCAYSDGFGRVLQSRSQAEEIVYGNDKFGDSGLPIAQNANGHCVGIENTDPNNPNVVVNGWTIYNNKGLPVEQYEPYFDKGFDYKSSLANQINGEALWQLVKDYVDANGESELSDETALATHLNTALDRDLDVQNWMRLLKDQHIVLDELSLSNDYVKFDVKAQYGIGTGDFSVEFWTWIDANIDHNDTFISNRKFDGTDTYLGGFQIRATSTNKMQFLVADGNDTWSDGQSNVEVDLPSKEAWHHVVWTKKGIDETDWTCYVDGVEKTIVNVHNNLDDGDISDCLELKIGSNIGGHPSLPGHFEGKMKEVRLYGRQITETEVLQSYNNGTGACSVNDEDLLFWAPLNEGSGDTVLDKSPYAETGEMQLSAHTWSRSFNDDIDAICTDDKALQTALGLGQKSRIFYDPRGQQVRGIGTDNTESRVIIGTPHDIEKPPVISGPILNEAEDGNRDNYTPSPWMSYAFDANDLGAQYQLPNDTNGVPITASVAKQSLGIIVPNDASQGYTSHYATPKITEIDELGRTIKTTEVAATADAEDVVMQYEYDIRGNVTRIIDAYDREVFSHKYDLANQSLWTQHIDSQIRTVLYDLMGRPTELKDAKGSHIINSYDELSRPIRMWAADNSSQSLRLRLRNINIFGDDATYGPANPKDTNHLGMPYKAYDEGGYLEIPDYHFSGAPLTKKQQVISDSTLLANFPTGAPYNLTAYTVDWLGLGSLPSILDARVYQTDSSGFDALGRPFKTTLPADVNAVRKEMKAEYNKAGAMSKIHYDDTEYIKEMAYNAKGQPIMTALGNGIMQRYAYSESNFRLLRTQSEKYTYTKTGTEHKYTYQTGSKVHNTAHQYDLAGNILKILERRTDCGTGALPDQLDRKFSYDPLNRLLSATGRESSSSLESDLWNDYTPKTGAVTASACQAYTRNYEYDKMGNIEKLIQTGTSGFTRNFEYQVPGNNKLHAVKNADESTTHASFTYDVNGNRLSSGSARNYVWDYADQLKSYYNQTGSDEPSIYAQYLYSGGQRVKKLVRTDNGGGTETTVYIDGIMEFRSDSSVNTQSVVHIGGVATVRTGYAFDGMANTTYELSNHLGSSSYRLGSTGIMLDREEYYPFGDTSLRTWEKKRYRYVGKEKDQESGLYYYGARYYAAWTCRFISTDPLARDYPHLTSFNYASNRPINDLDIDGMQTQTEGTGGDQDNKGSKSNPEDSEPEPTYDFGVVLLHKVEAGETMTSLSKTHNVSIKMIRDNNPQTQDRKQKDQINIGESLSIPVSDQDVTLSVDKQVEGMRKSSMAIEALPQDRYLSYNSKLHGENANDSDLEARDAFPSNWYINMAGTGLSGIADYLQQKHAIHIDLINYAEANGLMVIKDKKKGLITKPADYKGGGSFSKKDAIKLKAKHDANVGKSSGLKATSKVLIGFGVAMTAYDWLDANDKWEKTPETLIDLGMIAVGVYVPGAGWMISTGYFVLKGTIQAVDYYWKDELIEWGNTYKLTPSQVDSLVKYNYNSNSLD